MDLGDRKCDYMLYIKCKYCATVLLTEEQLTGHVFSSCNHYYMQENVPWLGEQLASYATQQEKEVVDGKIYCPGCSRKLGQFSWYGK